MAALRPRKELSEFGQHWGSAEMAERGRVANENTPKLRTFDSRGVRRDEVEFHPAYHELMARSAHAGVHNSTWDAHGKPAGGASEVVRAAKFYMAAQVETGHLCPVTMTRASVAALAAQPDLLAKTMPVIGTRAYDPSFAPWPTKRGMTLGMGMTEKQGGTDVRSNMTRAERDGEAYRIIRPQMVHVGADVRRLPGAGAGRGGPDLLLHAALSGLTDRSTRSSFSG